MAEEVYKCDCECAFCMFLQQKALKEYNKNILCNAGLTNQGMDTCKVKVKRVVSKTAIRNPIGRIETNKNTREVALPVI